MKKHLNGKKISSIEFRGDPYVTHDVIRASDKQYNI